MSITSDVINHAKRHGGVFTTAEAIAMGMSQSTINRRVADGIFVRLGRGVLALPGTSTRPDVLLRAAGRILGAVASHESAAKLHGLTPVRAHQPTMTVSHRGTYRFPGVRVHQSTDLLEEHVTTIGRIRVTSMARTIVDLAKVLRKGRLRRVIENALVEGKVDLEDLATLFFALTRRGKPGMKNLGEILAELMGSGPYSESELERMIHELLTRAGLPAPQKQFQAPWLESARGRVDLAYTEHEIVIEGDSRRWHGRFGAFEVDRRRDIAAQLAGWMILRITWEMVVDDPGFVIASVREALALRSSVSRGS